MAAGEDSAKQACRLQQQVGQWESRYLGSVRSTYFVSSPQFHVRYDSSWCRDPSRKGPPGAGPIEGPQGPLILVEIYSSVNLQRVPLKTRRQLTSSRIFTWARRQREHTLAGQNEQHRRRILNCSIAQCTFSMRPTPVLHLLFHN